MGRRFRCQDCGDAIGFDLCGLCQDADRAIYGRFNQKHVAGGKCPGKWLHSGLRMLVEKAWRLLMPQLCCPPMTEHIPSTGHRMEEVAPQMTFLHHLAAANPELSSVGTILGMLDMVAEVPTA